MKKHTCVNCKYCKIMMIWDNGKYIDKPVCAVTDNPQVINLKREHFCSMHEPEQ